MRIPGALETPEAVGRIVALIDQLTLADNGRFMHNRGATMPW